MTRAVYALMASVLFGALLVATAGFESLLLDRDVIGEPDAGPFLGPAMGGAALLVVLLALMRSAALADARDGGAPEVRGTFPAQPLHDARPARRGPRPGDEGGGVPGPRPAPPSPWPAVVSAAAAVWAVMLLVGSVGYAVVRGEAVWLVLFAARYALSPFVLGAVVCAALVVLGTLLLSRAEPAR